MKKTLVVLSIAASCAIASSPTHIKDEIKSVKTKIQELNLNLKDLESRLPKESYEFNAHAEMGYTLNSGNTDTEAFNLDGKVTNSYEVHSLELSTLLQYGTQKGVENRNRFTTELLYDYELDDTVSLNYLAGHKVDKFSGFDFQQYTGPGAKYKLIQEEAQKLAVDGNLLYARDKIEDSFVNTAGNRVMYPYPAGSVSQNNGYTKNYLSYRAKADYSVTLNKNIKFHQLFSYRSELASVKNFFVYSKSSLAFKITDVFSAGVNYYVDYINRPAFNKTATDKIFSFNLIADY